MTAFDGFPDEALIFYEGLEADNSKAYWSDHKPAYEQYVRAPMLALLAELEGEFGAAKVFRPYRDTRFSNNKTPYKTAIAATLSPEPGTGFFVQLAASYLLAGAGLYAMSSDQTQRLRRAIDDDVQGAELERITKALTGKGFDVSGSRLKTGPRGFSIDHPRIDLLRFRSLYSHRRWQPAPWLHERSALNRVRRALRAQSELAGWLGTHVGLSDPSPDAPS